MTLQRYLARIIWLCVAPLVLLALALVALYTRQLHSDNEREASNLVRQVAQSIDHSLQARLGGLWTLAALPQIEQPERWPGLYEQARGYVHTFDSQVALLGPGPQILLHTQAPLGATMPDYPVSGGRRAAMIALAQGEAAIGDLVSRVPISSEPSIGVAVPVLRDRRAVLALAAVVPISRFENLLQAVALPPGWSLVLQDSRGALIAGRGRSAHDNGQMPAQRHTATLSAAPWSVALEISAEAHRAPLVAAAGLLMLAVAATAALALVGGQLAGRRVARAVRSLAERTPPPPLRTRGEADLAEVVQVRQRLDEALQARDHAEAERATSERLLRERLERDLIERQRHETTLRDNLTELARARSEVERAHADLQGLVAAQDSVQEQERRRIAIELHDDLQQTLAAIQMDAAAGGRLLEHDPGQAAPMFERIHTLAAGGIAATRRIVNDLRPQMLEELGLVPALESLAGQFARRCGIACSVRAAGKLADDPQVSPAAATCLYRVAQESLNNVSKHSGATAVRIVVRGTEGGRLCMRISDNGRGLTATDRGKPGSFGLPGMQERVRALGGKLLLVPTRGGGLTLVVHLPPPT